MMRSRSANMPVIIVLAVLVALIAILFVQAGCSTDGEVADTSDAAAGLLAVSDTPLPQADGADQMESSEISDESNAQDSAEEGVSGTQVAGDGELDQLIQEAAQTAGMDVGVAVIDLSSGAKSGFQSNKQVVSASMIKLLIAYAFLEQVQAGAFSLDGQYVLQAADIVGGTGSLGGSGAGAVVTYRDLVTKMISESDNTATNILINAVGMDVINATAASLDLSATRINRHMMDYDAIASGIENYVSADDIAALLKRVYDGTFVDSESSLLVLGALEQQQDYGGILAGLPAGTVFAHKTGTLETVRHDGGIVEGDHPYILVVLCAGEGFYEQGALNAMAKIASVVDTHIVLR